MQQLTPREAEMLALIRRSIENGVVPSVRELCSQLGYKSTSSVHRYLTSLEEKGYIEREGGLNRSIRLPGVSLSHIPVRGLVTAGRPILAVETYEKYVPFPALNGQGEHFALYVRGDSMIDAGILDGDLLIVERTSYAQNGEIVVALIDDEATVKRFYKEKGGYRLQPENEAFDPIFTDHLQILGRVVGLQRIY